MLALVVKLPNERYGSSGRSTTGGEVAYSSNGLGASPVYTYLTRDLVSLAAISVTFGDGLYLWNVFGAS